MHEKSLTELRAALAAKECSAVELAQLYLKRIEAEAQTIVSDALSGSQGAASADQRS